MSRVVTGGKKPKKMALHCVAEQTGRKTHGRFSKPKHTEKKKGKTGVSQKRGVDQLYYSFYVQRTRVSLGGDVKVFPHHIA